jgi:hypothetical protein
MMQLRCCDAPAALVKAQCANEFFIAAQPLHSSDSCITSAAGASLEIQKVIHIYTSI